MKKYVGLGLAALAGYFVGFYEMKYKVTKIIAEGATKKLEEKESKEGGEKEEL